MSKITFYEALKRAAKAVIDKDVQAFLADDAADENGNSSPSNARTVTTQHVED